MFKKVLMLVLCVGTMAAYARPPAAAGRASVKENAPTLTPDQQAQLRKQAEVLAMDARKIALAIDRGQAVAVWDESSSVAKLTKRQDFAQQIFNDRAELGAPSIRKQVAITFAQSKGGEVPAGLYISVNYATKFARKKKPVRELISYHLDSDEVWRVSGYSVR